MTDHTPEPWDGHGPGPLLGRRDYERAKVCVNVCVGIPTKNLAKANLSKLVELADRASEALHEGFEDLEQELEAALAPFRKD